MDWAVLLILCSLHEIQSHFVWNTGGGSSLFVAIAIPLELHNKVFLSYNFEVSYHLPKTWTDKPPVLRHGNGTNGNYSLSDYDGLYGHHGPGGDFGDYYEDYHDNSHSGHKHKPSHHKKKKKKPLHQPASGGGGAVLKPPKHKHKRKHKHKPKPPPPKDEDDGDYKDFFEGFPLDGDGDPVPRHRHERSLLSRSKFYEILSHRFEQHGFGSGDQCLLRLICEANSYQLGNHNGVLGSLVHVMFSPTSSRYESLPKRYYIAELDGQRGSCESYRRECKQSILDLITQPILRSMGNKSTIH
ncbi:GL10688 [Drosophila persimilis]|uniref:GL10688 n=1 Tax=Drosophila persimilis TaxID=7234 RepID=B4GAL6_DROPE|nr:uncharacterized protein LOC6590229 [Drosophila persimilis]EDW31968.1 GL10688 [Drosophila persimilis]